jgi:medium-chain acyl-[acyl-carrier-protein] hydrolase
MTWRAEFKQEITPQLRLFCLPHAGGGAGRYRSWRAKTRSPIEITPIRLPGREGRYNEPALTDLSLLAKRTATEIYPLLDRPFALVGISFGALLAFEIAGFLQAQGVVPIALFLASHRPPRCSQHVEKLHSLDDNTLIRRLADLGGIDQVLMSDPELLTFLLATIRADLEASESHIAPQRDLLRCPLFIYVGEHDFLVNVNDMEAWKLESQATTCIRLLEGDHFLFTGDCDCWLPALTDDLESLVFDRPDGKVVSACG